MPVTTETLMVLPDPADILEGLDDAMRGAGCEPNTRVLASQDSRCPDEGLAILKCYVAIEDRRVRQTLLDLLTRLAAASA